MTFKAAILCIALTFACSCTARAEDKSRDLLVLYGTSGGSSQIKNLEILSELIVSLGKSADFVSQENLPQNFDSYSGVLYYDVTDPSSELMEKTARCKSKILVTGSSFLADYLSYLGEEEKIGNRAGQEKGTLSYELQSGNSFQEIVQADDLYTFDGDGYENGSVTFNSLTVPFCQQIDEMRFIPVTQFDSPTTRAAFLQELSAWLKTDEEQPEFAQMVVLDQVYPFMNPGRLKEEMDVFIEANMPFVVSVMPVFANGDYPAMKEFCQVLSYAQVNGGGVILHAPIIHDTAPTEEDIRRKLDEATAIYLANGVYPLGIQVPVSWLNNELYRSVLEDYSTVFVYEDGSAAEFDPGQGIAPAAAGQNRVVLPVIAVDETGIGYLSCYPSALYCDMTDMDTAKIQALADSLKNSSVLLANLWNRKHSVQTESNSIVYRNGSLRINDELTDIVFKPVAFDDSYDYKRDVLYRVTVDLKQQNQFLMGVVLISVSIFILFIIYARRRNRRHFLVDQNKRSSKKRTK